MLLGSRSGRVSSGFVIAACLALCGCHPMPLSRLEDPSTNTNRQKSLASAGRAALLPATVAMEPPSELSSIEPVSSLPANLTPSNEMLAAPTPLLDAEIRKAKALEAPPAPGPELARAEEPASNEPPPSSVFKNPLPIELPTVTPSKTESAAPVVANPSPEPAPKEPEPVKPEELWRDGVRKLNQLARAKVEQSGTAGSPWGLRSRLLAWLAEPDINPEVASHEVEGVRAVLRALDDAPADSNRKGEVVRSAVLALEDKAPLEIVDLKLCSRVEKFGDFKVFDPPVRKAGQAVAIYCEVDGLRFEQTGNGFRTRLAGQLEIVAESGGPVIHVQSLGEAEETCRKRRRDYYVVYKIDLPQSLVPGEYKIRLTERDLATDRSATRDVSFFIVKD